MTTKYSKELIDEIRYDLKTLSEEEVMKKHHCTKYVILRAKTPDPRKLSDEEVSSLLNDYYNNGESVVDLAIKYNTSFSIANNAVRNNRSKSKYNNFSSITMEELGAIIEEYKNGLTAKEVAQNHKVSVDFVYRICKENGYMKRGSYAKRTPDIAQKRKKKSKFTAKDNTIAVKEVEVVKKEKKLPEINFNSYKASIPTFTCGLAYSSKSMPVKDYIFTDTINNIFDFATLEKTIIDFLNLHKIIVNGTVKQNLAVYNYGLAMCLTSLIKVCNENSINLTIYHYNKDTNKYIPETVFNQFGEDTNKFSGVFHQDQVNNTIFIQDKDDTDDLFSSRFYIIRHKKNTTNDGYIFKNLADLFTHLQKLNNDTMKISNKDTNVSIVVEEGHIENSKYVKDQVLYRIQNY